MTPKTIGTNENNSILVLSDEPDQRQILVDVLEEQKYRVITSINGNEERRIAPKKKEW